MSNTRFEFIENTYYHIYNRGFQKQIIFKDKYDFERFYKYIIKEQKDFLNIKIVSYCFLPNHFHFIVHNIETGLSLSDFMRKIQGSYAMYFKAKHKTETGLRMPVFEGRFKAKIIENEEYLAKCLTYVNYNAIKHNIVKNIEDYQFTSYHQLTNKEKINEYKDLILDELEF
ncbi:MAG: transposase [Candidatus Gracilibacteria bacterium]|nr:transposase [Candidatus Gracilibacteria bacterium]MDD2908792.1 transposase [Candidatus Gracilibacteria bacterium]